MNGTGDTTEALPLGASTKVTAVDIIRRYHEADPRHSVPHQKEDNTVSHTSMRKVTYRWQRAAERNRTTTGKTNIQDTGEGRRDSEAEEMKEEEEEEEEEEEYTVGAEGDGGEITGTKGAEGEEDTSRVDGEDRGSQ